MTKILHSLAALVLALAPVAVQAAGNPFNLTVQYAAETVTGTGDHAMLGKLWRTPTALRQEFIQGGRPQVVIMQIDTDTGWLLMPDQKMAVQSDLAGLNLPLTALATGQGVQSSPVGRETIAGHSTTKYKVSGTDASNEFTGFVWATNDGILMKAEGDGAHAGQAGHINAVLRNVRIGPQDPALFAPPADYRVMKVRGSDLGAMLQMLQSLQKR